MIDIWTLAKREQVDPESVLVVNGFGGVQNAANVRMLCNGDSMADTLGQDCRDRFTLAGL